MASDIFGKSPLITPDFFAAQGFPPVVASLDSLYSGFHVEQYIHELPAIDLPPARDSLVIIALEPVHFSFRHGRQFRQGVTQKEEIILQPPGHSGHWEWQSRLNCLHLRFEPQWLQQMALQNGGRTAELTPRFNLSDPQVYHVGLALLSEVKAGSPNGRLFGESLANALAAHLLSNYAVFPATFKPQGGGLPRADLKRVTDYLHENLTEDVSLKTLASLVTVSPYYFARLFKQSTGLPPHQFVIQKRVERAIELLKSRERTVASAAVAVGFADAAHLTRHMKRLYGATPGQMRRNE